MAYYVLKVTVSAVLIVLISELAKKMLLLVTCCFNCACLGFGNGLVLHRIQRHIAG